MDKIVDAWYDEANGVSQVTLSTDWGTFTHTVTVDKEDADIANKWDGCKFAHYLCIVDKLVAKGHAFLERSKGMNHAANVIETSFHADNQIHYYDELNECIRRLHSQAYYAERDGKKYLAVAKKMKEDYPKVIKETLDTRRSFKKEGK